MLTAITLKNFRSYIEAELPLAALTIMIGANASGKSNATLMPLTAPPIFPASRNSSTGCRTSPTPPRAARAGKSNVKAPASPTTP